MGSRAEATLLGRTGITGGRLPPLSRRALKFSEDARGIGRSRLSTDEGAWERLRRSRASTWFNLPWPKIRRHSSGLPVGTRLVFRTAGPKRAGDVMFCGYLNRPEATAAALVDGWYHTGDLAIVGAEREFRLAGRVDDMIITGASNVYPEEVEAILGTHPAVTEVAVVGVPDERHGELSWPAP